MQKVERDLRHKSQFEIHHHHREFRRRVECGLPDLRSLCGRTSVCKFGSSAPHFISSKITFSGTKNNEIPLWFVTQVPNLKVDNVWVSETRLICYGNKQKRLPEVDDSASIIQLDFAADLLNFSHKILSTVVKTFLKFKRTVIVRRKEFPLNYTQ